MQERVDDYKGMGTVQVWMIDPFQRKACVASERSFLQPEEAVPTVEGTGILVPLDALFAVLG